MLKDILITLRSIATAFWDALVIFFIPKVFTKKNDFSFLVHPRGLWDTYKPFPAFQYLPKKMVDFISLLFPSITLSKIVIKSESIELEGKLIATVTTPYNMMRKPHKAVLRTLFAGKLAEKNNSSIIGLGAYLPALANYGRRFRDTKILSWKPFKGNYTTGHATTAWIISEFTYDIIDKLTIKEANVGIVGGAGSTGTAIAKTIARDSRIATVSLFDVDRQSKIDRMQKTKDHIQKDADVRIHTNLDGLIECDIIVVVTTAEGTLVRSEHLKPGAIVIDDSQPRNTSEDLMAERDDVIILDVLARFPGLNANFDFDLVKEDPEICFTCLAETAILAAHNWNDHFSMGILDVDKIDQIKEMGKAIGVTRAPYLSFNKPVTEEQWQKVSAALNKDSSDSQENLLRKTS